MCPTLLNLVGCESIQNNDSQGFESIFDNIDNQKNFTTGYAEYEGTKVHLTQGVGWMSGNMYLMDLIMMNYII